MFVFRCLQVCFQLFSPITVFVSFFDGRAYVIVTRAILSTNTWKKHLCSPPHAPPCANHSLDSGNYATTPPLPLDSEDANKSICGNLAIIWRRDQPHAVVVSSSIQLLWSVIFDTHGLTMHLLWSSMILFITEKQSLSNFSFSPGCVCSSSLVSRCSSLAFLNFWLISPSCLVKWLLIVSNLNPSHFSLFSLLQSIN